MKITIYLVAGLCCALAQNVASKSVDLEFENSNFIISPLPMPLPTHPEFEPNQGPIFRRLTVIARTTEQVIRRIIHLVRNDVDEISFYINSSIELFSAHAISEVYPLFEKLHKEIEASGNCGNRFTSQVKNTKSKLERNVSNCGQNLTNKREEHDRKLNVQIVILEKNLNQVYNNLTKACLRKEEVPDAIVCQVNGLATANTEVVSAQNNADFENAKIEKDIPDILIKTQECSEKAIAESKSELEKILNEVEKCPVPVLY